MKRGRLALVLVVVSLGPLAGCVARRATAAVLSYSQNIKPGMTRKVVEDYLRANKVQFGQMYCVGGGGPKHSLDDVIPIGTTHFPVPCGDTDYLVVFVFDDQTQHPPARFMQADDMDTLRSIKTVSWVADCF
jgi:hypothetical protein